MAMPDYAVAQQKLSDLRAQYNAELQRVEQDFNTKYEEFLEGQREFPETILHGIRQQAQIFLHEPVDVEKITLG